MLNAFDVQKGRLRTLQTALCSGCLLARQCIQLCPLAPSVAPARQASASRGPLGVRARGCGRAAQARVTVRRQLQLIRQCNHLQVHRRQRVQLTGRTGKTCHCVEVSDGQTLAPLWLCAEFASKPFNMTQHCFNMVVHRHQLATHSESALNP